MSDVPTIEFLRLFKVCVDVGSHVLRTYTDKKAISPDHGGSFIRFLSKENKHKLYHLWKPFKFCCNCTDDFEPGNKKEMQDWMFLKLYNIMDKVQCTPKVLNHTNCSRQGQFCLCRVIANQNLTLRMLDLSVLAFLIKNCILANDDVENILTIRGKICHAPTTDSFEMTDLENMWKTLIDAIMALAREVLDDFMLDLIKENINTIKKHDFRNEEIMRLSEEIMQIRKEMCQNQKNNSTDHADMKHDAKMYYLKTLEKIKDEGERGRQHTSSEINRLGNYLEGIFIQTVNSLTEKITLLSVKDTSVVNEDIKSDKVETDVQVRSNIDEEKVISVLNASKETEGSGEFKLVSAEKKCILLHMTAESDVFKDEDSLISAIQSLVDRIIQAGEIDTTEERTLDVTFTFPSSLTTEQRRVIHSMIQRHGEVYHEKMQVDDDEQEDSKPTDSVIDDVNMKSADIPNEIRSITSRCIIDMTNAEEATMLSNLQKRGLTSREGKFSYVDCQEHCILLELQFNPDEILCNTDALASAIKCLLEEVNEAGNIHRKEKEDMTLSFTFNGQLTEDELGVIQSVLATPTTTEKINVHSVSIEDLKGTHEDTTSSTDIEKRSFTVTYSELADAESLRFAQAAIPKLERSEYLAEEESNFLRFFVLMQTVATDAVRQRFDEKFPPGDLAAIFQKCKNNLTDLKRKRIITAHHWNLMFPSTGRDPQSSNFDFSLMICLFRHLTKAAPIYGSYDLLPRPSDVTLGADLARIKYYRNKINHFLPRDMRIDSMDMKIVWNDVSEAIARIGGEKYAQKCSELLTKRLDSSPISDLKETDSQSVKDRSTTSSTT